MLRFAMAAILATAPAATAAAQTIGLNAGSTGSITVAPSAKLTVPIIVDLASAGALSIAGLQTGLAWNSGRITFDSIRVVIASGWSLTPNTTGAPSGSIIFNAFGFSALPATGAIANAYFTASAVAGGTRVSLAPTAAANDVGNSILASIRPRGLDVCIGVIAKWGDVNDDGVVNISDAQQIGRFSVGLSVANPTAVAQRGDVTADGVVNISDAQQVARFSVGLPASPRVGTDLAAVPATTGITVSPSTPQTLVIGSSRQIDATPVAGATDLTGCAGMTWGTSNGAVATVNSSGYVTAVAPGTANITATNSGFTAQVTINVTSVPVASVSVALAPTAIQVGATSAATATTRDAGNNIVTGRVIAFSSSNTNVATVNPTTGVVTGVAAGTATIFATSEGITGFATITVTAGVPVASVTVAFGSGTIAVGGTTTATATLRDAGNNILTGRPITWTSSNTGVATVNAAGLVTAIAGGTANIIATADGISGQAAITVSVPPVTTVNVSLGSSSIVVGSTTTATATTLGAGAVVLTGRVVNFTSSNTSVATVGLLNGVVTGVAAGSATIFATSEGITGQVTITVTATGIPVSVTVSLGSSSIQVGASTSATATLRDAGNNVISGATTWSSSAPSIAAVNASTGAITGVAAGTATIVGTSGSVTGQASITITFVPVASVTTVLTPSSIGVGGTSQATATTFDAAGNILTGRVITWSSLTTSKATVNSITGLVTGVATGTSTIRATVESRIGNATITVTTVPVASVTVTLGTSTITVGGATTTATAVTRDAGNNILTGRTVTWTSSNTSIATVNSTSGVVTAVAAGSANIIGTSEGVPGQATVTVQASANVGTVQSGTTIPANSAGTVVSTSGVAAVQIPNNALPTSSAVTVTATTNAQALSGTVFDFGPNGTTFAQPVTISITYPSSAPGNPAQFRLHKLISGTWTEVAGSTVNTTTRVVSGPTSSFSTYAILEVAAPVSNEPAGMTLLAERPFNCVKPTACESTWYYAEDYANAATLVSDPTAPKSLSNVVQQNFTSQLVGGSSPASLGTGLANKTTMYVSMWMKLSSNFQGHPTGTNKVIHMYIAGSNRIYFMAQGTSTLVPSFGLQGLRAPYTLPDGTSAESVNLTPNITPTTITRGAWVKYEWVVTANTPGVANGTVKLWQNGVLAMDYTGIMFTSAGENSKWEEINWSPTWGGGGGTIGATFFAQMDHMYVSGKN